MGIKNIKNVYLIIFSIVVLLLFVIQPWHNSSQSSQNVQEILAVKFERLAQNGNSSCSANFANSIDEMKPGSRLQGSCCSPMDFKIYSKQVEGLKKYTNILEIPPDPYDIDAGLAQKLKAYYDVPLSPEEQKAYDYAMEHSHEKGPCCCKCWRWYVYGGLAKKLIHERGFQGEQIVDVWNLSDGCGGAD